MECELWPKAVLKEGSIGWPLSLPLKGFRNGYPWGGALTLPVLVGLVKGGGHEWGKTRSKAPLRGRTQRWQGGSITLGKGVM